MADKDLIKTARKEWLRCQEAEEGQRKQMLEDKNFRRGGEFQWPDAIKIQRAGGQALQGQAAQPARPMLTIDRLSGTVRQISNTIRGANFAIDVLPNGHGADDDTADIFKGYLRRMQNMARDESPVEWAADQAVESGFGVFRLRADYVYTPTASTTQPDITLYDQELKLERITNNLSVYGWGLCQKPTWEDASVMFVTDDISRAEFTRRFPKADAVGIEEFASTGDAEGNKNWSSWAGDDYIRIAEYWHIDYTEQQFALLEDGSIVPTDQVPKDVKPQNIRAMKIPSVQCDIINAVEVLETHTWLGSHIPLIPILGEEINVDGHVIYRGIINEAKDPQRMVNYTYSAAIETTALANKAPIIVAEGQLEGYEKLWEHANTYNYSYLPYKPVSLAGAPVPPPQRDQPEPAIQALVLLMQKSEEGVKVTTGIYDPGLGNTNPREKSGRAIMALQQQSDLGQSNYLDNVNRALVYAGELALEVIPKITRKGQILQILGIDDEPQQVMANQPFTEHPETGQLQPAQIPEEVARAQKGMHKFYDLNAGRYAVTVSVGKSFVTKRQEAVAMIGDIVEKNPQLLQVLGDIFFRDLDFPGSQEISERMKKLMPPQLQDQQQGQLDPAQVQAFKQQTLAMIKQLTEELNAKNKIIETDQIKAQADLQKEQLKAQSAIQEAQVKGEIELQKAAIQAEAAIGTAEIKAALESQSTEIAEIRAYFEHVTGIAHEAGMQAREHAHEARISAQQQAHEQEMGAQQAEAQESQIVTKAAVTPKPEPSA